MVKPTLAVGARRRLVCETMSGPADALTAVSSGQRGSAGLVVPASNVTGPREA
jgi:hypothetical protein